MSAEPFTDSVLHVTRSRRRLSRIFARVALASAVGPVALMLLAAAFSAFHLDILHGVTLSWLLAGWLLGTPNFTYLAWYTGMRQRCASGIEVDAEAIRFHSSALAAIPRHAVDGAFHVSGLGHHVEIGLASGDVLYVDVETAKQARALVTALGFGASEQRTVVQIDEDHGALAAGCWGVVFGVIATVCTLIMLAVIGVASPRASHFLYHADGYIIGAVFVSTSLLFARMLRPKRVVIGTDGVIIERTLGRLFLPLAAIGSVDVSPTGVWIKVTQGPSAGLVSLSSINGDRAASLRDRIREAMDSARHAGADASPALLARGSRSLAEWREAMRKLVTGGGYRGESVSIDALVRAAERADVPVDQRIGAAMAIGLTDDDAAKQRLRIAVSGIAHDTMRAAMNRAAEGAEDEAAIEEALAAEKRSATR